VEPLVEHVAVVSETGPLAGVIAAASVALLVGSLVGLILTARQADTPRLPAMRAACVPLGAAIVVATVVSGGPRWALAVGCLGFLLALEAVALRFGQVRSLESYLSRVGSDDEPFWWPEFERSFRRYSAVAGCEQNPLRRGGRRGHDPR
jgi:hypothetical protein